MTRCWIFAALAIATSGVHAADATVATYEAAYRVLYRGKEAGSAEFSVRYLPDADAYEFVTRTEAKGLLKLARPNPAIERSRFRVAANAIQPLEFQYEDGSRSGEDNLHIVFDWQRGLAVVSDSLGRRELALTAGALDRGSLQVTLMRDLARNGRPGRYLLADEDSVSSYEYVDDGVASLTTRAGTFEARVLSQQRTGSSRATRLWLAPALRFLPIRIEQQRDGEVQTALELVSVRDLPRSP